MNQEELWGFLIEAPTHWLACRILSVSRGVATFVLHGDTERRRGRARQTKYGWLVE